MVVRDRKSAVSFLSVVFAQRLSGNFEGDVSLNQWFYRLRAIIAKGENLSSVMTNLFIFQRNLFHIMYFIVCFLIRNKSTRILNHVWVDVLFSMWKFVASSQKPDVEALCYRYSVSVCVGLFIAFTCVGFGTMVHGHVKVMVLNAF